MVVIDNYDSFTYNLCQVGDPELEWVQVNAWCQAWQSAEEVGQC